MCFIMGRKLKFLMKEGFTMSEEKNEVAQATTENEVKANLIKQAQEFAGVYGVDQQPTTGSIGRTVTHEDTMKWCMHSIEQGISLMNEIHRNVPDYNLAKMMDELKKLGKEYNNAAAFAHYAKCRAFDNPIMGAIEHPTYLTTKISEVFNKEGEDRYKVEMVNKGIDLVTLHDKCKDVKKCGENDLWIYNMGTILMLMIVRGIKEKFPDNTDAAKAEALKTFNETYKIKKIVEGLEIEGEDETSVGKLTKALREMITMMIGEEYGNKAHKADVRFLYQVYCMGDRRNDDTVKYLSEKEFSKKILAVLRRIVKNEQYKDSYKKKK